MRIDKIFGNISFLNSAPKQDPQDDVNKIFKKPDLTSDTFVKSNEIVETSEDKMNVNKVDATYTKQPIKTTKQEPTNEEPKYDPVEAYQKEKEQQEQHFKETIQKPQSPYPKLDVQA